MPIEFYCPGCGNLMRTPDETAGRKGRCPTCQLKVQIPANSVAATSSESAVPRSVIAANPKGKGPEPIRFDCGCCGKTLSIAAANAGKKGQCPHCGQLMSIPMKSSGGGERWKGTPKQNSKPSPARPSTPGSGPPPTRSTIGDEKIEFPCSSCHELVRVGVAAAGKKGLCPRCSAVTQIPLKSTSAPGLQPIPKSNPTSPSPQRKPVAPTSGLTPLPSSSPAASGLTPLDDGGLSPLEPLGLTPLGSVDAGGFGDDLFGIASFGPSQVDDGNPFASNATGRPTGLAVPMKPARPRKRDRTGAEIANMICGGCLTAYAIAQLLVVLVTFVGGTGMFQPPPDLQMRLANDPAAATWYAAFEIIFVVLSGIVMLTILAGGIQMIRFKAWGLCLAACILTMMPCNCFCLLGLPIGIWGTTMLSLATIRSAFH